MKCFFFYRYHKEILSLCVVGRVQLGGGAAAGAGGGLPQKCCAQKMVSFEFGDCSRRQPGRMKAKEHHSLEIHDGKKEYTLEAKYYYYCLNQ
jgi:hypothetical protein